MKDSRDLEPQKQKTKPYMKKLCEGTRERVRLHQEHSRLKNEEYRKKKLLEERKSES